MNIDKRLEIITAYHDLVSVEGFKNVSLSKIANRISKNPSLIFHYFENKKDLTLNLVDYILEKSVQIAIPEIDYSNKDYSRAFNKFFDEIFKFEINNIIDSSIIYAIYDLGQRDETVKEKLFQYNNQLISNLEEKMKYFRDHNVIKCNDLKTLALYIQTIIEGLAIMNDHYGFDDSFQKLSDAHKNELMKMLAFNILKSSS